MSRALSRAEFCQLSLSGLVAAATSSTAPPAAAAPDSKAGEIPKRALGSTGARVSMLGLGGAHIGSKKVSDSEAIYLMHAAADGGITFFDNCWDYNHGRSEELMGKALAQGYRHRVFLMTKLDGRTAEAATRQLEQSLKRLRTEVIDLVQIHEVIRSSDPERVFERGGAIEAFRAAKKAGKLRFIGFTGHKDPAIHLAMLERAEQAGFRFDAVQMPLNVMDAHYKSFERHVLPLLQTRGIAALGMKSMGSGDILKSGVVTAEECLRYSLSLPVSVLITGIDSRKVLEQDLQLARTFVPLSATQRNDLLARTAKAAAAGKYELFKSAHQYDGTLQHPKWLEKAQL